MTGIIKRKKIALTTLFLAFLLIGGYLVKSKLQLVANEFENNETLVSQSMQNTVLNGVTQEDLIKLQGDFKPFALIPADDETLSPKSMMSSTVLTCDTCVVNQNLTVNGSATVAGTLSAANLTVSGDVTLTGLIPQTAGVRDGQYLVTNLVGNTSSRYVDSDSMVAVGGDGFARSVYVDSGYLNVRLIRCLDENCSSYNDTVVGTDLVNGVGYPSIQIGSDNFPRILYFDWSYTQWHYVQCLDLDCSTKNNNVILTPADGNLYFWAGDLALDSSDLATIVYDQYDGAARRLKVAQCTNAACTASNLTTITSGSGYYEMVDIEMGSDNLPRLFYGDSTTDELYFVNCTNAACSSNTIQSIGSVGSAYYLSMDLDSSNFGRLFYGTTSGYVYRQCTNAACSASSATTIDANTNLNQTVIRMASDGYPRLLYVNSNYAGVNYYKCLNDSCSSREGGMVSSTGGYHAGMGLGLNDVPMVFFLSSTGSYNIYFSRVLIDSLSANYSGAVAGSSVATYGNIYTNTLRATDIVGLGSSGSQHIYINSNDEGKVAIGTDTVSEQLTLGGNMAFPKSLADLSAGYFMQGGSRLISSLNGASTVTAVYLGLNAGPTSSCNGLDDVRTAIGVLSMNTACNVHIAAIGYKAMQTGAFQSTAIGANAGRLMTGGQNNAVGVSALENTTGGWNNGVGAYSLVTNLGGGSNVAIGANDDFSSPNTTGGNNVYIGYKAGYTETAGNKNTTGGNNTYIGSMAGPASSTQYTRALAIGYKALAGATGAFILGGTGADAVNVGINTDTPDTTTRLHVVGHERIDGGLCIRSATNCPTFSAGRLYVDTAGTVADDSGDTFDIAEMYAGDSLSPAELVVASGEVVNTESEFGEIELPKVLKPVSGYDNKLIGVVSTKPAIGISGHFVVTGPERQKENSNTAYVALLGRVPVKVTNENGMVKAGDYLTSSDSKPGYAMKATRSGQVVGKALQDFNEETGEVLVFVNPGYQIINNTFVIDGVEAGQYLNEGTAVFNFELITGDKISLQASNIERLFVESNGVFKIATNINTNNLPILEIENNGESLFVVMNNKLQINSPSIKVGPNVSGTAKINKGDDLAKIEFSSEYKTVPKVIATPLNDAGLFAIVDKNTKGFGITLLNPAETDIYFDWYVVEEYYSLN